MKITSLPPLAPNGTIVASYFYCDEYRDCPWSDLIGPFASAEDAALAHRLDNIPVSEWSSEDTMQWWSADDRANDINGRIRRLYNGPDSDDSTAPESE